MTKQEFIKRGVYVKQIFRVLTPVVILDDIIYSVENYYDLSKDLIKKINYSPYGIIYYHPKNATIRDDEFIRIQFLSKKHFNNEPLINEKFENFYNNEI